MWTQFALVVAVLCVMLFAPGALLATSLRLRPLRALAVAPVLSTLVYVLLANVYAVAGVPASGATLFIPALLASVVAAGASLALRAGRRRAGSHAAGPVAVSPWRRDVSLVPCALCLAVGLVAITAVFVKNLDGPASYLQEYDNVFHLGVVHNFVESGSFSFFNNTLYSVPDLSFTPPSEFESSFYPSAWHCLAAMAVTLTDASVPLVANALNTTMAGIVFPLTLLVLVDGLFRGDRRVCACTALSVMAVGAFPWVFLLFGPLHPNLMSYVLLPAVIFSFYMFFEDGQLVADRVCAGALFVMGMITVAASQPNAVFTAAVFLAPFVVWQASRLADLSALRRHAVAWRVALSAAAIVIVALIWQFCFGLDALQDTVTFDIWKATTNPAQAVVNVLTLGLTSYTAAQPLVAAAVAIGFARVLTTRRLRWMAASYCFAAVIYVVAVSSDGDLKQLLAGFWYADPPRLAATIGLFAIPLAALGVATMWGWVSSIVSKKTAHASDGRLAPSARLGLFSALAALWMVTVFYPSYAVPGRYSVETAFGRVRSSARQGNDQQAVNVFDEDEREFVEEALSLMPEDSLIINEPNDGSAFAYATMDANLYYRYLPVSAVELENDESRLIRMSLDEYASDSEVRDAVASTGARYVLVLDMDGERTDERRFLSSYYPEQWEGINELTDDTPGFKVLLAEGDMRLYELTAL